MGQEAPITAHAKLVHILAKWCDTATIAPPFNASGISCPVDTKLSSSSSYFGPRFLFDVCAMCHSALRINALNLWA